YSYLLAESGRFEEAIREATEALSHDPMSGLLNAGLAWVLLNARHYDRCIEQALTALEVDSNMIVAHWALGTAYEQKEEYDAAIQAYERANALGSPVAFGKAFVAHVRAKTGACEKAWDTIRELEHLSQIRFVPQVPSVIVYDGLAETGLAMEALERACLNREANLVQIKAWPQFDAVRDHPRFREVDRRVGLRR